MSRSTRSRGCAVAAIAATATLLLGANIQPAQADPVTPGTAPVMPIVAPVADIDFITGRTDHTVVVQERRRSTKARLDTTVLFAKDRSALRPGANKRIATLARQIAHRGKGRIEVIGYTDDLGSAAHGRWLSRRRASAVAAVLARNLGPGWPHITVVGMGEKNPAVPNIDEQNRQKNRRVVVIVRR